MRVWVLVLAAAAAASAALACGRDAAEADPGRSALALAALPEAARCEPCHATVVRKWLQHGMADAMGPLPEDRLRAAADGAWHDHAASGARHRVEPGEGDGWIIAEERILPPPGLPPPRREMQLQARIGAGVQDQSFVAVEQGRWFFAPLELAHGRDWIPSPFQLTGGGSGLGFRLTPDCLSCHTEAELPHPFPFHALGDLPVRGISCAACHGDGSAHAADGAASILNPSDLPPARQLDLCARCHLEGDAHVELLPESAPRFAPGADLLARRAVLVARDPGAEAPFVSQVHRLSLSACFRQSPDMTCTSCHDPHLPPRLQERAALVAACGDCHAGLAHPPGGAAAGQDCVSCHMPQIEPFDLPGARIADHWIRRQPEPRPPAGFREHESPEGNWETFRYRAGDPPRWSAGEQELLRAMALADQGRHAEAAPAFESWSTESASATGPLARLPMLHFMRGLTMAALQRPADAEPAYRMALSLAPDFAEARLNLGWLLIERGAHAEALTEAQTLARAHPAADAPALLAAAAHDAAGRPNEAMQELQRSLQAYGAQPAVLQRLGRAAAAANDFALARRALLAAWSLDPRLPGLAEEVRAILARR